ncbi:hypothetical protein [Geomesophilobacter sediminis]|uniref:Uncharacterized protein n=1 Tax=Geomesophilobacter sediminis TaxID=2798584 RepID=A0A8J7M396_9BACT|nr:hypothetical protein [Geomesophilobacter sediminis]MBJ6727965.1 hypothetical protein [Geomesophilobacter sediminis]
MPAEDEGGVMRIAGEVCQVPRPFFAFVTAIREDQRITLWDEAGRRRLKVETFWSSLTSRRFAERH